MRLLIIIPAHNEEGSIERVVTDIVTNYSEYDYLVVDDGSSDNTYKICKNNNYNCISLLTNLGLDSTFQTGLKYALENNYDFVLQYDGDGQHKAKYIKKLLDEMIKCEADIVIGSRYVTIKKPKNLRIIGSYLISFAIRFVSKIKLTDPTSGMRLYNNKTYSRMIKCDNLSPEPDTLSYLAKQGYIIKEVQVEMDERESGTSYLNSINSIKYMTKMLLSILIFQFFRNEDQ